MKIRDLIKQLEDMLLIYGDRIILTITDIESEYNIKEIKGKMCAKYFEPSDHVAEVTIRIKRNSSIKTLPSVTPKRKTGQWIHEIVNSYTEKTYCSECGKSAPFVYVSDDYYGVHTHGEVRKTDFCPHCGADMRGERE